MLIYKKRIPIYENEFLIVINDNFDESLEKFKLERRESYNGCDGLTLTLEHKKTKACRYMILLRSDPYHNVISHEAMHLVHKLMDDKSFIADFDNDEAECYLMGYIVEEIYSFLDKNKIVVRLKE